MPPDPCDIDSFSGSHATGLGSGSISSFSPVFSSSALEIPTQFPSPPAHAPGASVRPSTLGDRFHPMLLSASSMLPMQMRLQTHVCLLHACMFAEGWSVLQKGAWVNQTGQKLWQHGFHQTWSPYICLFSIVLFHLFCSLTGLLDSKKVRGPPWTPHLYAYPSVIVIAIQPTFDKACSWYFSMANIKCWESVKLPINGKI